MSGGGQWVLDLKPHYLVGTGSLFSQQSIRRLTMVQEKAADKGTKGKGVSRKEVGAYRKKSRTNGLDFKKDGQLRDPNEYFKDQIEKS